MTDVALVRAYVLDAHADLLEAVLACADAVADTWAGESTTDRRAVVEPFERALDASGITDRLPSLLVGAARAIGAELPAEPVPAPPYLALTSVGPVLRATLDAGRLVVTVRAFAVERDPTRYVRGPAEPRAALDVEFRRR